MPDDSRTDVLDAFARDLRIELMGITDPKEKNDIIRKYFDVHGLTAVEKRFVLSIMDTERSCTACSSFSISYHAGPSIGVMAVSDKSIQTTITNSTLSNSAVSGSTISTVGSTMTSSVAQGPDFDPEAFKLEVGDALHGLLDHLDTLEEGVFKGINELLLTVRRADLSTAKSLSDVRQMLEDVWTEEMKKQFNAVPALLGAMPSLLKSVGPLAKLFTG
ncbi:hypothetical protein ACNOYE_07340 [Nannocystaceae bacterium ST9]